MQVIDNVKPETVRRISAERYVLHGTDQPLEIVEPRHPKGAPVNPVLGQFGLFATQSVEVAIARAVVRDDPQSRVTTLGVCWYLDKDGVHLYGSGVKFQPGYVLVLPITHFEKIGRGVIWISKRPAETVRAYRFYPSVLLRLRFVRLSDGLRQQLQQYLAR